LSKHGQQSEKTNQLHDRNSTLRTHLISCRVDYTCFATCTIPSKRSRHCKCETSELKLRRENLLRARTSVICSQIRFHTAKTDRFQRQETESTNTVLRLTKTLPFALFQSGTKY
jgi:hypothetical protein